MTDIERRLLNLFERRLRRWYCERCHTTWFTGRSQVGLYHRCQGSTATGWDPRTTREKVNQERTDWARRQLGGALEDALGDKAFLAIEEDE